MVKEAVTAPEQSYATAFWPENGAVAALPGRFVIQVRRRSVLSKASGEGPGAVMKVRWMLLLALLAKVGEGMRERAPWGVIEEGLYMVSGVLPPLPP